MKPSPSQFDFELNQATLGFDERLDMDVATLLKKSGLKVAVAESMSAGLLADRLTRLSGSSDYFVGGVICYAPAIKLKYCGVMAATLSDHGAVSPQVATEMAKGIQKNFQSDIGISITGYASPDREAPQNTGLVFIGIAFQSTVKVHQYRGTGDRDEIKNQAVAVALTQLKQRLSTVIKKEILNGR